MTRSIKRAVILVIILFSAYSLVTLAAPLPQNETRLFPYSADGQSYGFVDTTGEWAIEPEFEFAGDFVDGLAVVAQDGKYGYIDSTGAVVIEPKTMSEIGSVARQGLGASIWPASPPTTNIIGIWLPRIACARTRTDTLRQARRSSAGG